MVLIVAKMQCKIQTETIISLKLETNLHYSPDKMNASDSLSDKVKAVKY